MFDPVTYALAVKKGGGGGGGTSNYNSLENKPQINGVTLSGDKSTEDLIPIGEGLSFNADGELEATGGGSAELSDDMTTAITVGGISAGTAYQEGTSLETVIRDMLEPTLYPTITPPSITISVSKTLYEKGTRTWVVPNLSISRGSISPAYGTDGYRAGAPEYTDLPDLYWYYGSTPDSGWVDWGGDYSNGFLVQEGSAVKWYVEDIFADGQQPKDSKGNNYLTPYSNPDGEKSNILLFKFAYVMWANTSNIATVAKLSLIDNTTTKQRDLSFPAQTVANPEVFDVPASWTVTAVQVKNDLSGAWEDASSQFTVTDTTHPDAGNNTVNYKRYTFNMGVDTGARQIRVKWS